MGSFRHFFCYKHSSLFLSNFQKKQHNNYPESTAGCTYLQKCLNWALGQILKQKTSFGPMGIIYFPILLICFFPTKWSTTPRKKKELKQHKIFHRVFIINLIVTQTIKYNAVLCMYMYLWKLPSKMFVYSLKRITTFPQIIALQTNPFELLLM